MKQVHHPLGAIPLLSMALLAGAEQTVEELPKVESTPREVLFANPPQSALLRDSSGWISRVDLSKAKIESVAQIAKGPSRIFAAKDETLVIECENERTLIIRPLEKKEGSVRVGLSAGKPTVIDLSSDSALLAIASSGGMVAVHDVAKRAEIWSRVLFKKVMAEDPWGTVSLRFTPDRSRLIALGVNGGIVVLEALTGKQLGVLEPDSLANWTRQPHSIAVSLDSKRLVAGCHNGDLRVWNLEDSSLVWSEKAHTGVVGDVAFAPDGESIASVSQKGTCSITRASDGVRLTSIDRAPARLLCVAWAPDSSAIIVAAEDGSMFRVHGLK